MQLLTLIFDITVKPGMTLPPAWKCSKCKPSVNHVNQAYTYPPPPQTAHSHQVPSYVSVAPTPHPPFQPPSYPATPSTSSYGSARHATQPGPQIPTFHTITLYSHQCTLKHQKR
eukprot:4003736-Ditylum_brightwellii.AAC.1